MPASGPSPKRRRTDDGPPSADAIAQSNATMHLFTGQRQNRWMSGVGVNQDTSTPDGVATTPRPVQTRVTPANIAVGRESFSTTAAAQAAHAAHAANRNKTTAAHGVLSDGSSDVEPRSQPGLGHQRSAPDPGDVVDYHSPSTAETSAVGTTTATTINARKSLEPINAATSQQGLPSPARSDENTNSPNVQYAPVPVPARRGRGRPRRSDPRGGPPPLAAAQSMPVGLGQSLHLPHQRMRTPTQPQHGGSASPSVVVFAVNPDRGSPVARQGSGSHNIEHGTPQASVGLQTSGPLPAQAPARPGPPHLGSMFDHGVLLRQVNAQLDSLKKADPAGLGYHNIGRLNLLQEAVLNNDWFYIVLSQLSCLRSVSPVSLPQSAQAIGPQSYEVVDSLLCANRIVHPMLLAWFAQFPLPIMSIYSSNSGVMYEAEVRRVVEFLSLLPSRWQPFFDAYKQRRAPPLAQDMAETLRLFSPTLQATVFRAIARSIWSGLGDAEFGIEYLTTIHQWDWDAFVQGRLRTPTQKVAAYQVLREVVVRYQAHVETINELATSQQRTPLAQIQNQALPPFQVPRMALTMFRIPQPGPGQAPHVHLVQTNVQETQRGTMAHQRSMSIQRTANAGSTQQRPYLGPPAQSAGQLPTSPVPHNGLRANARRHLLQQHVFPRPSVEGRAQPTHPDPKRSALHQARLRSPIPGFDTLQPTAPRMYRQVYSYATQLTRISGPSLVHTIVFNITANQFRSIAQTQPPSGGGELPSRELHESTQTYRLRCVRNTPAGYPNEASWVTAENVWPDSVYFQCNGTTLEPRRKLHHGRYLPIDVTQLIKEGSNTIKVFINRGQKDPSHVDVVIAVEGICAIRHETIIKNLRTISAQESLSSFQKALTSTADGDEDISMTSSTLVIKLFDPISGSKMFDVPVRGKACLHRDCFDLETYLSIAKREQPGWPSVVDTWRCPVCRGDARPSQLIRDGFLVQMREELVEKGLLSARAIVVESDGSWKPKEEEVTGVRSASLEREERNAAALAAKKPAPVIIELD